MIGYFLAYFSFIPFIRKDMKARKNDPDALAPESRLYWLLWSTSFCLPSYLLFLTVP